MRPRTAGPRSPGPQPIGPTPDTARPPPILAVAVVVPARDEQERIEACLASVLTSLAALPATIGATVCVVLDRCRDETESLARQVIGRATRTRAAVDLVSTTTRRTVEQVRNHGVRRLLRRHAGTLTAQTWVLSTDADTVVPADWALRHLRHADTGADIVAGLADLDDPGTLSPEALCRYTDLVTAGSAEHRHTHAYGANLGVRAAPFLAVGGFPAVAAGEEHALLARLRGNGYRVAAPLDVRVRTSARRHGRAQGGLADLIDRLHDDQPA